MPAAMLIGKDEVLLETRAAVLRTAGLDTICCDVSVALEILEGRPCDLVLFCHSLPGHLCEMLADIIYYRWPGTHMLLLSAMRLWEDIRVPDHIDGVCPSDPRGMIDRSIELLAQRRRGSIECLYSKSPLRIDSSSH